MGLARNVLSPTSLMMLCAALAATSLFATQSWGCLLWQGEELPSGEAKASWGPWLVLATLGFATGVGAVLYPLPFDATLG